MVTLLLAGIFDAILICLSPQRGGMVTKSSHRLKEHASTEILKAMVSAPQRLCVLCMLSILDYTDTHGCAPPALRTVSLCSLLYLCLMLLSTANPVSGEDGVVHTCYLSR